MCEECIMKTIGLCKKEAETEMIHCKQCSRYFCDKCFKKWKFVAGDITSELVYCTPECIIKHLRRENLIVWHHLEIVREGESKVYYTIDQDWKLRPEQWTLFK